MAGDIPVYPGDHRTAEQARAQWSPGGPGQGKTPATGSVTPAPAPPAGNLRLTCTVSVADPCGQPATQLLIADDPTFGLTAHPRCERHPAAWYGALLDKAGIGTLWLIVDLPPAARSRGGGKHDARPPGIPCDLFGGAQGCST